MCACVRVFVCVCVCERISSKNEECSKKYDVKMRRW